MTTIAEQCQAILSTVGTDDHGYRSKGWRDAIAAAREMAVDLETGCPDSCDSMEILTFADDSRLLINNPRQSSFAGESRVLRRKS